jgi:hypothetical protein
MGESAATHRRRSGPHCLGYRVRPGLLTIFSAKPS